MGIGTSKRYVLYVADGELSEENLKDLGRILESRHGSLKVIPVKGNPGAVIVKTNNISSPRMRDASGRIELGGRTLTVRLTSGAIGKLKRAADSARTLENGEVPQR